MSDRIQELELKRVMQEYAFLNTDYEYKKQVVEEFTTVFIQKANELLGDETVSNYTNQTNADPEAKKVEKNKIDPASIDTKTKEKIKHVYREISKKTHPDKDVDGIYAEHFLRASEAYQNFDLYELYNIANSLQIEISIDINDVSLLRAKISERKNEVSKIENSYLWLWYISDDTQKMSILENFIKNITTKK
jgi:hypothetical protein